MHGNLNVKNGRFYDEPQSPNEFKLFDKRLFESDANDNDPHKVNDKAPHTFY